MLPHLVSVRLCLRAAALSVPLVIVTGCAGGYRPGTMVPPVSADAIEHSLFLIGDAGDPRSPAEPVLMGLEALASERASQSTIVFLGDNVYDQGMPPSDAPDRLEAERRMTMQMNAVPPGTRAYFVMGNHDWLRGREGGWEAVKRQAAFVGRAGRPDIRVSPPAGCPGPVVRDLSPRLRLVLLDTQWWLTSGDKPEDPTSACDTDSRAEVTAALRSAVRVDEARHVVVVGHHPLRSGGVHGGRFDWQDHIFPLTAFKSWLWLPLPVIGSLYPIVRGSGVSAQDVPSGAYREMRDSLAAAFAVSPPLAYAAGHEHNLQVLDGGSARYLLVTGAGRFYHTSKVFRLEETRYARRAGGFMRLDVLTDGRVRLAVVVVDGEGRPTEDYSLWLVPEGG